MASMPATMPTTGPFQQLIGFAHMDYDAAGETEYTQRHREAWSLLLAGSDAETLVPSELSSWLRLWGRFGGELFRAFRDGDAHIRADMIARARASGSWRGEVVASRLEQWRQQLQ